MKKFSLILLILLAVKINAQVVNIPDANFKMHLVNRTYIDTNKDKEIQVSEALAYKGEIFLHGEKISDLTGIEAFENLTSLTLRFNGLTVLNVSKNTKLEQLTCDGNQLTSIDLSKNISLSSLNLSNNQLTSIDLSKNINLNTLGLTSNKLTTLVVSKNTKLEELNCYSNQLTSIDLSNNTSLKILTLAYNKLTELSLKNNVNLTNVNAVGSQLNCVEVNDPYFAAKNWAGGFNRNTKFSKNCAQEIEYPSVNKVEVSFNCNSSSDATLNAKLFTKNIPDGVYTNQFYYVNSQYMTFLSEVIVSGNLAVVSGIGNSSGDISNLFFGFVQESSDCLSTINENESININRWNIGSGFPSTTRYQREEEFCMEENGIANLGDLTNRLFGLYIGYDSVRFLLEWFKSDDWSGDNITKLEGYELLEQNKYYFYQFTDKITGCKSELSQSRVAYFVYLSMPYYNANTTYCSYNNPNLFINSSVGPGEEAKWYTSETGSEIYYGYTAPSNQTLWLGSQKEINIGEYSNVLCYSKRVPYMFTEVTPAPDPILQITEDSYGTYTVQIMNYNSNYDYTSDSGYSNSGMINYIPSGSHYIDIVPNYNFWLSYEDKSRCSTHYNFEIKPNTLSNSEFQNENSSISFSPNPTQGKITFTEKVDEVKVFDLSGRLVKSITVNTSEVDLSDLTKGVYIMQVNQGQRTFTTKVIKE